MQESERTVLREWYESGTKVVREWYGSGTGVLREWCERAWGDVLDVSTSATLGFGRTTLLKKSKISRIVFGGFELDTPKATIQNRLWVILNQTNGYSKVEVLLATSKGIQLCAVCGRAAWNVPSAVVCGVCSVLYCARRCWVVQPCTGLPPPPPPLTPLQQRAWTCWQGHYWHEERR